MSRIFNITGTCIPEKHFMADTSDKLGRIIHLIEQDAYFTINRARQYGKTTTLMLLWKRLKERGSAGHEFGSGEFSEFNEGGIQEEQRTDAGLVIDALL